MEQWCKGMLFFESTRNFVFAQPIKNIERVFCACDNTIVVVTSTVVTSAKETKYSMLHLQ